MLELDVDVVVLDEIVPPSSTSTYAGTLRGVAVDLVPDLPANLQNPKQCKQDPHHTHSTHTQHKTTLVFLNYTSQFDTPNPLPLTPPLPEKNPGKK